MAPPSLPLARRLAEWSAGLTWDAVPDDLRQRVPLLVLDHLGLVLAARDSPPGEAARAVARAQGGSGESAAAGGAERLPAAWTAFVHGTLAHSFDFDDTLPESVVHPGSVVVSTALAVAQPTGADGRELGAAIVAGYEVAARLGAAAGRGLHARGFQATGVLGPVVAALVAARLYRLSPSTTAEAMGLAGSMGGGLLEFLADGSWAKRMHPGWAAHGGVVAAQLAARRFPGPPSVLEGRHGLYAAFLGGGAADLARIPAGLGSAWLARDARAKLYPCAHVIHPYLRAGGALRGRRGLGADDVAGVTCDVAPWQVPIVCEPRREKLAPRTEYQARASLPYALAAMLLDGRVDLETFDPAALGRAEVLALAARIRHRPASDLGGDAAGFAARVEVTTREGRQLVERAADEAPPGPDAVLAKFRLLAARRLPPAAVAALEAAAQELAAGRASALLAAMGSPPLTG